jgi:hypothetical protein
MTGVSSPMPVVLQKIGQPNREDKRRRSTNRSARQRIVVPSFQATLNVSSAAERQIEREPRWLVISLVSNRDHLEKGVNRE